MELATLWSLTGRTVENLGAQRNEISDGGQAGVLSRPQLLRRLRSSGDDRVVITPLLDGSLQPAGVDVRLAPDFIVFRHSATRAFDPLDSRQDPRMMQEPVEKAWGEAFILHPGELVLAATLEYVVIPFDLAAHVVTRSSYGRLGLITATAVQVQPGSRGTITLELVNQGETPIALTPGARIAQLVFFTILDAEPNAGPGKYRFPVGPEFSKVQDDSDTEALIVLGRFAEGSQHANRNVPLRGELVSYEIRGDAEMVLGFQAIAAVEHLDVQVQRAIDLPTGGTDAGRARLSGDAAVVSYFILGTAVLRTLSNVIVRLVRGLSRGALVQVANDGVTTITTPDGLPRGVLVVVNARGQETRVVVAGSGTEAEVDQVIAGVLPPRLEAPD